MRIKNLTSNACNQCIFCFLVLFLVFFAIDIAVLYFTMSSGATFGESFAWMFSVFSEADAEMKFVYILFAISPVFWLLMLIYQIKVRISDEKDVHNQKLFIKYIDFTDDKIKLSYLKSKETKEIYYKDIDSIELVIDTCIAYNKYGPYSILYGLYINIKSGSYSFSIHHAPVDLNKMYKVIYYSQYMKDFSYRFTGSGEETKEKLQKTIDKYIENGYKMTRRYSSVSPVLPIILFVALFCGFIVFFISLFNNY